MTREERELSAGPKPDEREGFRLYAKLNHNRFGDSYIWVYQRIKRIQSEIK